MLSLVFFFFKQKTAYEMRISDWSSDVCSSDLGAPSRAPRLGAGDGAALADPRDGDRGRARHPLHRRYIEEADPPLPESTLHLDHGRRQSGSAAPLARLAGNRAIDADCGCRASGL